MDRETAELVLMNVEEGMKRLNMTREEYLGQYDEMLPEYSEELKKMVSAAEEVLKGQGLDSL